MANFGGYDSWINNRFNVIIYAINNIFGHNFLQNKSILELGAGYGDFGYKFYKLGMNVTCLEGRIENLNILQQKHPYFESELADLDKYIISNKFDVILHAGLLYHMKNITYNLENCLAKCDIFILETENIDSTEESDDIVMIHENGSSCAMSSLENSDCTNYSSRTTRKFLENIFIKNGFEYVLLDSPEANTMGYKYDWKVENTKNILFLRSIYIAYKKI
jgi:2-polyprenyl-3-methyl-5-hydroxy-6-metoxy-1,4-benzoquinol methylase